MAGRAGRRRRSGALKRREEVVRLGLGLGALLRRESGGRTRRAFFSGDTQASAFLEFARGDIEPEICLLVVAWRALAALVEIRQRIGCKIAAVAGAPAEPAKGGDTVRGLALTGQRREAAAVILEPGFLR